MVTRISDLTATHPNLWLVEVLITRLQAQNSLTDEAANRIKEKIYQAIHAGEIKSHDAKTTLQISDPGQYTPLITADSFGNWLVANGSTLRFKKPRRAATTGKKVSQPSTNWKNLVQKEATRHILALRAAGASPSVFSILNDMVLWCRKNNVKTSSGIIPSSNYLRTHVLGGRYWKPPK